MNCKVDTSQQMIGIDHFSPNDASYIKLGLIHPNHNPLSTKVGVSEALLMSIQFYEEDIRGL